MSATVFWDEQREDSLWNPPKETPESNEYQKYGDDHEYVVDLLGLLKSDPEEAYLHAAAPGPPITTTSHCTVGRPVMSENKMAAERDPRGVSRSFMQKSAFLFNQYR